MSKSPIAACGHHGPSAFGYFALVTVSECRLEAYIIKMQLAHMVEETSMTVPRNRHELDARLH